MSATCNACPSFFRAQVTSARSSRHGYEEAGYHLAIHAREMVENEVDAPTLAALDQAIESAFDGRLDPYDRAAQAVVGWLETALPRCMALVPRRRRDTFARGVARAIEEERI